MRARHVLPSLLVALAVPAPAAACGHAPSDDAAAARAAAQLVTVVAARASATTATLRLWRRDANACWRAAGGPWRARVGRNGLSSRHREGDGTTPLGTFPFGSTAFGTAPDPGVRLAYHRLACGDWWDEDPSSPTYNTFRHVRCGIRPPFGAASEALWTIRAYRHFVPIAYNAGNVPGRGSAIFLHDDVGRATNGCVAVAPGHLDLILRWLSPPAHPAIAITIAR